MSKQLPLCKCGCGNRVETRKRKYFSDHFRNPPVEKSKKKKKVESRAFFGLKSLIPKLKVKKPVVIQPSEPIHTATYWNPESKLVQPIEEPKKQDIPPVIKLQEEIKPEPKVIVQSPPPPQEPKPEVIIPPPALPVVEKKPLPVLTKQQQYELRMKNLSASRFSSYLRR